MLNLQSLCQKMQHCIGDWFAFVKKTNVIYDVQSFARLRTTWLHEYLVQNERKKKVKKENQLQTTMYIVLKSSFTIPLRGKSAWFAKLCLIFSSFWEFFYRLHCYACSWQQVTVFMRVSESFNQPIYSKMLIHSGMEQVSDSSLTAEGWYCLYLAPSAKLSSVKCSLADWVCTWEFSCSVLIGEPLTKHLILQ